MLLLMFILPFVGRGQVYTFQIADAYHTYVTCVNDSNHIGGYFQNSTGIHGFVFAGTDTMQINYPNAAQTYIYGLNNNYIVVGAYNMTGNTTNNEGFAYNRITGIFSDLTSGWIPGMDITITRDINDANCIVGDYKQNVTHNCFLMCNGNNSSFHYNYKPTYINSINNTGRRAGFWIDASFRHGLIYSNGSWTQVDYPGSNRTMMTGMNDSSTAVGIFNLNRSFFYKNGIFREIKITGATEIQVRDINNHGLATGYYKDASNTYKGFYTMLWDNQFRPYPDGWRFSNSEKNIWPASWWVGISYRYDPYLGGEAPFPDLIYPDGTVGPIKNSVFPDWPLFVELMGEDQCYEKAGEFKVLKFKAFLRYKAHIGKWGGSCFGFAESSFMAYDSLSRFKNQFPLTGPWATGLKLYNLPITDDNRKCINLLYLKQMQIPFHAFVNAHYGDGPNYALWQLKQTFLDNSKNETGLLLFNQNGGGGHIVNPYKILIDTMDSNIEYIYVYDNNYPNDTTRRITINKGYNYWQYDLAPNADYEPNEWGGYDAKQGLLVDWPVREYYKEIPLSTYQKNPGKELLSVPGEMTLFNNGDCDFVIKAANGQRTGFLAGVRLNEIPGSLAHFPLNSLEQAPNAYTVPSDTYQVQLKNFRSAGSGFTLLGEYNAFTYDRPLAGLSQKDIVWISEQGIRVENSDNESKNISLTALFSELSNEMEVGISKMNQAPQASIGLETLNATKSVKLTNTGGASSYMVSMRYISTSGESKYTHDSVFIAANTTHIISPEWDFLKTTPTKVFVDNGSNSSIEDTLYLGNDEPAAILVFPFALDKTISVSTDTIHITNNGGGTLAWSVVSTDTSWLHITTNNSGSGTGSFITDIEANTGSAREANLLITGNAGNAPFSIKVSQKGIIEAPGNVSASDGTFNNEVHVLWGAAAGAGFYQVYRSDTSGKQGLPITSWITQTSWTDTTMVKGNFHYYSIRAAQQPDGLLSSGFSKQDAGFTACFAADFSFSSACAGLPITFTDETEAHAKAYSFWDIHNDGTVDYTGLSASHIFDNPGTYAVRLRVTDSSQCSSVVVKNITIGAFPLTGLPADTSLCAGQSLSLDAGQGYTSYQWSTGATSQSITIDTTGYGFGINPVYVQLDAPGGCSHLAAILVRWDTCAPVGGFNLSGRLTYDNTVSTPLGNTTVRLMQDQQPVFTAITDAMGNYSFGNIPNGVYNLSPICTKQWGGVNSTDALKVLRHFTGLTLLNGVRLAAADVNASNSVNSVDALLIAKRFVALTSSFIVGDWIFEQHQVQVSGTGAQTIDIKGVVYGDVDGSYIP
jgi:hypothetical protein